MKRTMKRTMAAMLSMVAVGWFLGVMQTRAQEAEEPLAVEQGPEGMLAEDLNISRKAGNRMFWHEPDGTSYEIHLADMGEYKIFVLKPIEE